MGEECTFQEYLKSHGLFASKSHIYLMSTLTADGESLLGEDPMPSPIKSMNAAQEAEGGPAINDVFMGCSRKELAGELKSLQVASTPDVKGTMSSNPIMEKPQVPLFGLAIKESESILCTSENTNEHRLMIHYEMYTESSYSEVVLTSTSFSRKDCYDIKCVSEPLLQDMQVDEFEPLENGFSVVHISKGQKCFLDVHVSLDESPNSLPSAEMLTQASLQVEDAKSNRLILHPPSEVWGYDSIYLILGAVNVATHGCKCHLCVVPKWSTIQTRKQTVLRSSK